MTESRYQPKPEHKSVELLEAEEGAAFGAAILAGVGLGAWPTVDEACQKTIRVREVGLIDRQGVV